MTHCPCGSGRDYARCCGPILAGEAIAPTAEALMRSRYTAYVERRVDYLGESLHPDHRGDWDREATRGWAERAEWLGLEIRALEAGGAGDQRGWVEFVARYREGDRLRHHRERSRFERSGGRWYYVEAEAPRPETQRRSQPRVGRNQPCPCGSGKKYKRCCGA